MASWAQAGTFIKSVSRLNNASGFAAMLAMDMMCIFSLAFFRNRTYNLFRVTHTIGILTILPGVRPILTRKSSSHLLYPKLYMHRPDLQPYMIAAIAIYGADKLMSMIKTRIKTARISNLDQLKMAYIEIPSLNQGWRAGQHVRLRVLSSGMGVLGWAESHPFTIASAGGAHEGLVLLCKQAGDWTEKLVALSKQVGQLEKDGVGSVKVCVDGPYGGPSRMVFSTFSSAGDRRRWKWHHIRVVCGGGVVDEGLEGREQTQIPGARLGRS